MAFPASIWIFLGLVILIPLVAWGSNRHFRAIPVIQPVLPGEQAPDCMVVIPARDEEKVIVPAIKSLPQDSVIVVDDASKDWTAAVSQAAGAGVLKAPPLSRGTNGKANACAEGARVLSTKWILFADADTRYEPGFLESVIAWAETDKIDFLSIYLRPEYRTRAERVLGPLVVLFYFFGINAKKIPADAFAGQCILVRREAYEFVGGYAALRKELSEDVKLAALALRHRMKIGIARAEDLGHVRIRVGEFSHKAHRYTQVSFWVGARTLLGILLFTCWMPVIAWLIVDQQIPAAAALLVWLPISLQSTYRGVHHAFLSAIGVYWLAGLTVVNLWHILTGRPDEWKGRVI